MFHRWDCVIYNNIIILKLDCSFSLSTNRIFLILKIIFSTAFCLVHVMCSFLSHTWQTQPKVETEVISPPQTHPSHLYFPMNLRSEALAWDHSLALAGHPGFRRTLTTHQTSTAAYHQGTTPRLTGRQNGPTNSWGIICVALWPTDNTPEPNISRGQNYQSTFIPCPPLNSAPFKCVMASTPPFLNTSSPESTTC